mmetsp:Transcript_111391/g.314505  ORF Transcript_111391/g.314505 Transcript_111391/m.314505 type:complete len:295 (-) Transcript_111391:188-1072(-)
MAFSASTARLPAMACVSAVSCASWQLKSARALLTVSVCSAPSRGPPLLKCRNAAFNFGMSLHSTPSWSWCGKSSLNLAHRSKSLRAAMTTGSSSAKPHAWSWASTHSASRSRHASLISCTPTFHFPSLDLALTMCVAMADSNACLCMSDVFRDFRNACAAFKYRLPCVRLNADSNIVGCRSRMCSCISARWACTRVTASSVPIGMKLPGVEFPSPARLSKHSTTATFLGSSAAGTAGNLRPQRAASWPGNLFSATTSLGEVRLRLMGMLGDNCGDSGAAGAAADASSLPKRFDC